MLFGELRQAAKLGKRVGEVGAMRIDNGDPHCLASVKEKEVRARRSVSFVHMLPVVPFALPDRHETPLVCLQNQAPANRFR